MNAPNLYLETFPDLPAVGELATMPRLWARGRTWDSGELRYTRPAATKVAVTFEQHRRLLAALSFAPWAWGGLRDAIAAMWPRDFLKDGKTESDYVALTANDWATLGAPSVCAWPDGMTERLEIGFRRKLDLMGMRVGTMERLTAERAADKAVAVYRKQIDAGGAPFTWADSDRPAGVSVRLVAGAVHGAPVAFDGIMLRLGDFGDVGPMEPIDAVVAAGCAYAEMAHWEQSWRVRFVTTSPRERKEKSPRAPREKKAAAPKESVAPTAAAAAPVEEDGFMGRIDEKGIAREGSRAGWDLGKTERYTKWLNWQIAHGKPYAK